MKAEWREMSVSATGTIRETLQAIERGAVGAALLIDPVTERFAGLVTDGDVRRALLAGLGLESSVSTVSRPRTLTAPVGTSVAEIASLFSEPVRLVPLLDERGRLADVAIFERRVRLPIAEPLLGDKELAYVTECVLTGWISSAGKFVTRFEEMFADFCGTRYAVATSNGTAALHLSLLALDIGPGDEVIVPTLTFIATANTVRYTGATPVFVDSERETWNLDPAGVERAITPRTKAIVPVHLYGHPANMRAIRDIAERHGLKIVEDAAEAHGARCEGRPVGSLGEVAAFSFYGNKIVTTGEGGMVTTNRSDLNEKMRILRDHGMSTSRKYWHPVLGYNYRLTNLQAAIGVAQMEKVHTILASKKRIAEAYTLRLAGVLGVTPPPNASWASNVYWLYSILLDPDVFGPRDEVSKRLKLQEIETRPLFLPAHSQPPYGQSGSFSVAEELSATGLSLPSAPTLSTAAIDRIAQAIMGLSRNATVGA